MVKYGVYKFALDTSLKVAKKLLCSIRRLLGAHQENPLLLLLLQHCRRARLGRDDGGLRRQHRPHRRSSSGGPTRHDRSCHRPLLSPRRRGPRPQHGRVQVRPQGAELLPAEWQFNRAFWLEKTA